MGAKEWRIENTSGKWRVIVTKELPGRKWLDILTAADCRVEIETSSELLDAADIEAAIGDRCDGAIGQITEAWQQPQFGYLQAAGARAYSNYAVGFDNVDVKAATDLAIPVGNTPGVLTETTAEMAVALTFAAARRIGEAERFTRKGLYQGWLPQMLLGELLWQKTVGIIGAGRIGAAYAKMMVEGHKMNVIYYDVLPNESLEAYVTSYSHFLGSQGLNPLSCRRAATLDELFETADCISIHTVLDTTTQHLINAQRLAQMKPNAILVNTSRGPVIDEAALVAHCRRNPDFRAGLDVFEQEPALYPGLADLENVVVVPHIASASLYARHGMAILAACNIAGLLQGLPVWNDVDYTPFLQDSPPPAVPSVVNADELGLPRHTP